MMYSTAAFSTSSAKKMLEPYSQDKNTPIAVVSRLPKQKLR